MRTVDEWTDRYAELLVEEGWGGAGEAYVREADRRALRRLAVEMRDEIVSALARALAEKAVRAVLGAMPCDRTPSCSVTLGDSFKCAPCAARSGL